MSSSSNNTIWMVRALHPDNRIGMEAYFSTPEKAAEWYAGFRQSPRNKDRWNHETRFDQSFGPLHQAYPFLEPDFMEITLL